MMRSLADWLLLSIPFVAFVGVVLLLAKARREPLPSWGEDRLTCGCPRDGRPYASCLYCDKSRCLQHVDQHKHDDLMAVADAVADDLDAEDWQLWERQMERAEQ
jgi:hypothetical protein